MACSANETDGRGRFAARYGWPAHQTLAPLPLSITLFACCAEARDGRRTSVTYHLTYPVEGQGLTQGTIRGGLSFQLAEGDKIAVLYDPHKPSRVQANRFESLWGFSSFFAAMGLVCLPRLLRKPA